MLGTLFDMAACGAIGGAFGILSTNSFLYDLSCVEIFEHADGTIIILSFRNTVCMVLSPFFRRQGCEHHKGKGGWHTRDGTGPRRRPPRVPGEKEEELSDETTRP